ncbi:MAG: NHLP bacteriocin system secretion protein [Acidobacteria bacterium]|nr:MAG: NHLP bacteriocin system secretion protein [Acidobacteriota bacterium]PYR74391.1 MAG: NHLP bacteriocin system secretion protein [Acidobacteriota bacterium]
MPSNAIFRKVALDRLASPEQLDQLMQVTDPRGWIALVGLSFVVATAVAWGVLGSVHQNVHGAGILVRSGGVFEVVPLAGGRVIDVSVAPGAVVNAGQVVARLDQPDLLEGLARAKATLAALRDEHQQTIEYGDKDIVLQTSYLKEQRTTIEHAIAAAERNMAWYQEKIASQQGLVTDGLLLKQALLTTQQQYDAANERLADARSQLAQLEVRELELHNKKDEAIEDSELKLEEHERALSELERELKAKSEVVAPQGGRILEVMTETGAVVAAGQPVLSLDLTGRTVKDLEAVMYVPSIQGKQIRVGMPMLVAPATVKQEEFGMMLGRVTYVSDFPATMKGMQRMLKNERLVAGLAGSDAPYEVHADLVLDPATVSRYRWTSSQGPPTKIESGTLAAASITVTTRRPIELVIPLIREYLGL